MFFNAELRTLLLEALFDDLDCERLVHSDAANSTLVATTMWGPSVLRGCPWTGALSNQLLFVLLGLFALVPVCLLVYKVLFIAIDLGQAGYCVGVDELVIFILHPLPLGVSAVLQVFGPLPGCQCCIPLAPTQLRFIAWGFW